MLSKLYWNNYRLHENMCSLCFTLPILDELDTGVVLGMLSCVTNKGYIVSKFDEDSNLGGTVDLGGAYD